MHVVFLKHPWKVSLAMPTRLIGLKDLVKSTTVLRLNLSG